MYKGVSAALVVVGIMLIIWGIRASNSFGSDMSRFFTGSPTDRTIWFLTGGVVLGVIGLFGLFRALKGK